MEEAARIITRAFSNCMTDRWNLPVQTTYYISFHLQDIAPWILPEMGYLLCRWPRTQVLFSGKFLFSLEFQHRLHNLSRLNVYRLQKISSAPSMLTTFQRWKSILARIKYAQAHHIWHVWLRLSKVTYRYYLGMLSFLNEDYAKVRLVHLINSFGAVRLLFYSLNRSWHLLSTIVTSGPTVIKSKCC